MKNLQISQNIDKFSKKNSFQKKLINFSQTDKYDQNFTKFSTLLYFLMTENWQIPKLNLVNYPETGNIISKHVRTKFMENDIFKYSIKNWHDFKNTKIL